MKQINVCPVCGGKLERRETEFVCLYCNGVFSDQTVEEIEEKVNSMLDEFKQELVANTRTQLWDAIHEKYLSSKRILNLSRNIKTYLPDDFLANFFEFVNTKSHTQEQINEYINNIDYKEYYYLVDVVLDFMIRSLEPGNLLCLNNLIENTYKQNYLKLYNEYTSRLAKEAEKVKSGVYDLTIERDVFVAYSSKDIKYVEEVVKLLNQEGISYFVALENLRHGKGAVENYDKALEQAIENCKTFLFISSTNSRTRECDALKKEIPYLKKLDKLNAPAEYRNDYSKMPLKYKKPRVQLLIGDTPTGTLGDKQVAEVFDGYEWRYDAESAIESIYNFLNEDYFEEETEADKLRRELAEQARQQKELEEKQARQQKELEERQAQQKKELEEKQVQQQKELEEKQTKQIEDLKKMLADMLAKQNESNETKKDESSVEQEDAEAQNKMGKAYYFGEGVKQDYEQAVEWFEKAAEQGFADAQCNLGYCYYQGSGIKQNFKQAVLWFEKAAKQGHAKAQNELGIRYYNGEGVKQDYEQAVEWFIKAAEQGFAEAQYNLGNAYSNGEGVTQNHKKAVEWYEKAAEQGFTEAQHNLGCCYYSGEGVKQDYEQAVEWFRKAAEQGYAQSQYNLGYCYYQGSGIKQNFKQAVLWFEKAANQDFKIAQNDLAVCYANGIGVDKNPQIATYWYNRSKNK